MAQFPTPSAFPKLGRRKGLGKGVRERAETMFLLTVQAGGGSLQRGAEGGSEAILYSWYKPTTDPYKPCECGVRGAPLQTQRFPPPKVATRTSSGEV